MGSTGLLSTQDGAADPDPAGRPDSGVVDVEIVVPVHNEAACLRASVEALHAYLSGRFPLSWVVTVTDNASTDGTWAVARRLATTLEGVRAVHLDAKGRGRALRATWSASRARVVAYMDVDLSTDLDALLPLVAPLLSGHSDVAIGTRLAPGARVVRGPKREAVSRVYNLVLRTTLHNRFSDAQCGFKAVRRPVADALLPLVEDEGWFFDTELLAVAEHNGLRIHEVPVDWVDDPDSRVDILATARQDLRGVVRVLRRFATGQGLIEPAPGDGVARGAPRPDLAGQLVAFAGVGLVSTAVFAGLFAVLAGPLGLVGADVVALAACGIGNLAANRRLTFASRGRPGRRRQYRTGLALTLLPLVLTLGALGALHGAGVRALVPITVAVTASSLAAGLARFLLLRRWVFGPSRP